MASLDLEKEVENFYKFYSENVKIFEQAAEYYRSLINSLISDDCEIQSISYRVKEKEECVNKFKGKYLQKIEEKAQPYEVKEYITDIIGIRVICLYESEIQKIRTILEENFQVIEVTDKIKTLDSTDNQFGYKSLHIDLRLNDIRKKLPEFKKFSDLRFEVQIRTIIQDAWSVLDHKIKYKKSIPADLKRRINRLAALFEIADDEFYNIKLGTASFEEKAKNETKPDEPLNVLSFLQIASEKFPTYQFISYKADGFVHEILRYHENLSQKDFMQSMIDNFEIIKEYNAAIVKDSPSNYLNPYTMIRHCLYLSDKVQFKNLLFDIQKTRFEEWLETLASGEEKKS
jgi:putative GTP pyrophosphokinase